MGTKWKTAQHFGSQFSQRLTELYVTINRKFHALLLVSHACTLQAAKMIKRATGQLANLIG